MRRAAAKGAAIAAALICLARSIHAQTHSPSIWEAAANPQWADEDRLYRDVESLVLAAEFQRSFSPVWQEKLGEAMTELERRHADKATDVRLRFKFGQVASLLRQEERAVPVLESALRDAPDHPAATYAYFELGVCYAKAGRPEDEITVYDEYLRRQTHPGQRALACSNRAEAQMLLGRLGAAISDYRASLRIEPENVLTHWGLAVALDRSADVPGALAEAKIAITYDPLDQQLASPNVFFVPAYDRYWYEGLGAMAHAQQIDDAATAILWWETAVAKWSEYVAVARADDPWLRLAKAHQSSCERQLEQAKKRAARSPKPRRPGGREAP